MRQWCAGAHREPTFESAMSTRTRCTDGTLREVVRLDKSSEQPTIEELNKWVGGFPSGVCDPGRVDTQMTARNLAWRLETRLLPTSEEQILIVRFISQDGHLADKKKFNLFADRTPMKKKRLWR